MSRKVISSFVTATLLGIVAATGSGLPSVAAQTPPGNLSVGGVMVVPPEWEPEPDRIHKTDRAPGGLLIPWAPTPGWTPRNPRAGRAAGNPVPLNRPGRGKLEGDDGTWRLWWALARETWANVRGRYHDTVFRGDDPFTPSSRDAADGVDRPRRPSDAQIANSILPALSGIATGVPHLRGAAAIAMARSARPDTAASVLDQLRTLLREGDSRDRRRILMALGILDHADAHDALLAMATDSAAGRRLLDRVTPVPESLRAHAALALRRSSAPEAAAALRAIVESCGSARGELGVAAATALGLMGRHPSLAADVVATLATGLRDGGWRNEVEAAAALALGRTGQRAALPILTRAALDDRTRRETRHAAIRGLGLLASGLEPGVAGTLLALASDSDPAVRTTALITLGEMAARDVTEADGSDDARAAVAANLATALDAVLGSPRTAADLRFAGLAAGLFARSHERSGEPLVRRLVETLADARSRDAAAPLALALGLTMSGRATDALRGILETTGDPLVRGYAAEALGLRGDLATARRLLHMATNEPDPLPRLQAALALGFLADPSVLPPLLAAFETTGSDSVRAALARGIGILGDRRAVPVLLRIALDREALRSLRERAVAALGLTAERGDLSATADLARGAAFLSVPEPLRAALAEF